MALLFLTGPSVKGLGQLREDVIIRDGSFEDIKRCPNGVTARGRTLDHLKAWSQPAKGTPDLFSRCSRNYESRAPFNTCGYQHPYDSASYVGLLANRSGWREYVTQSFMAPLKKDSMYQIELWVSLADNSRWASDSVGIGLSTGSPHSNTSGALQCDTLMLTNGAITDTTNWVPLRFIYKACGTERHIVIGCFSRTSQGFARTGRKRKPVRDWAYYYVDAVSVRMMPSVSQD